MVTLLFTGPVTALVLAPILQAAEGSSGIPWWVWFVLVAVLLLLLLIGFARQPGPGEPLPKPGERTAPPAAAAAVADTGEEAAPEAPAAVVEAADEKVAQKPDEDDSEPTASATEVSEAEPAPADDLKRIEGIGPKISGILGDNGIKTFAALATAKPEQLQEILDTAGIRLAHPGTWPEQAALAAAGQWDELEAFQDSLKGGRKE